jgi:hypothetical protein
MVLPPLLLGGITSHFGAPAGETSRVVLIGLVFFVLIPLGYLLWLLRRGYVATLEVRDRARRTRPLLVGQVSSLAAVGVLWHVGATAGPLVVAVAACVVLNMLLLLVINLRWKISVHTAALAGFASTLLFVLLTPWAGLDAQAAGRLSPALAGGLLLLLPLLMWARVHVGAHTRGQVLGGALFGLVLPYFELYLLSQGGVFAVL